MATGPARLSLGACPCWTATIAAKARPCGYESAQQKRVGENSEMSSRHKQFRKRLAIVEKSLSKRSPRTETPLCVQVQLEAQRPKILPKSCIGGGITVSTWINFAQLWNHRNPIP